MLINQAEITLNQYQDGYFYTNDDAGEGHIYRIKSNPAASGSGTLTLTLDDNDKIKVALTADPTSGLVANPYNEVVITPPSVTSNTDLSTPPPNLV